MSSSRPYWPFAAHLNHLIWHFSMPMVQPWLSFAGPSQEKIEALKRMMEETGVRASVEEMRALYYRQALEALAEANVDDTQLKVFAQALWDRKF